MPWLSEAMKDVISCDKLRIGANNRLIRRSPNGVTYPALKQDIFPSNRKGANPGN
jgi:hypothetical protein